MYARRDAEFTEYVAARLTSLRRVAYLLCRDWDRADDLVQGAITKLYVHWGRAAGHTDSYVRVILVREFLRERRSGWARRVRLDAQLPDFPAAAADRPVGRAALADVVEVADHVRYGVATRPSIEFPVQLTGLPAASRVADMYFVSDAGVLRASQYSLTGSGPYLPDITVDPATARSSCSFTPGQSARRTIGGYRVTVNHIKPARGNPPVQQVCAPDADGLMVFISTYGRHATPNAISIFAQHTRLLGTNPADWTTRPLR
jgi:DNA-directed RNA polymerase specialized sigma24 family protein